MFPPSGVDLSISIVDVSPNSFAVKEAYGERLGGDDFTDSMLSDAREMTQHQHGSANIKERP